MSDSCRVSGKSIKFVYNIHERKGGKGCSESLQELTAGAEKFIVDPRYFKFIAEPKGQQSASDNFCLSVSPFIHLSVYVNTVECFQFWINISL